VQTEAACRAAPAPPGGEPAHGAEVNAVALRGSLLLSGGADGKVVAWRLDLAPKRPEVYRLRTLRDPRLVAEARALPSLTPSPARLPCTPSLWLPLTPSLGAGAPARLRGDVPRDAEHVGLARRRVPVGGVGRPAAGPRWRPVRVGHADRHAQTQLYQELLRPA
jgi:hypothetical protein